mmetsp:Transcript_47233/g.111299  ORF Transcript_47233/g.111299 Transcript_47233/m.111299 type:complete len:136 (+) Transcript_47233:661-1068(+)
MPLELKSINSSFARCCQMIISSYKQVQTSSQGGRIGNDHPTKSLMSRYKTGCTKNPSEPADIINEIRKFLAPAPRAIATEAPAPASKYANAFTPAMTAVTPIPTTTAPPPASTTETPATTTPFATPPTPKRRKKE